jgi:Dyp-type peroxidase family
MVDVTAAMSVAQQPAQAPVEPLLDVDEIQGNVIPGFMKPRMGVLALALDEAHLDEARAWIAALVPQITTLAGVMPTRMKVRAERLAKRVTAGHTDIVAELDDCWLNVAFSYHAIASLLASPGAANDADSFADEAFKAGLAARSALIGDAVDPTQEGNPANWVFGGPGNAADVLLVFGADRDDTLRAAVDTQRADAEGAGMTTLYEELGGKLNPLGQEHFGFQDGVSQPGVRGRIPGVEPGDPEMFLTPRTIAPQAVPEAWMFGQPGQYLLWPGAFVLGYETPGADPMLPALPQLPGPAWSKNGSFAVYRRLRQDVPGFRAFAEEQAALLAQNPGFEGMTGDLLQSRLFGRWPSGAPLSRTPGGDVEGLGKDPLANNHFDFAADTPTLPLIGGGSTNGYPEAKADPIGLTCPQAAHIRKVNTRDLGSDQGGRRSSFQRRILRRALPYGPPLPDSGPDPADGDRGLMFLCYQASIVDQFEFLNSAWMNDPIAPRSPGGFDMVIGQNGEPGAQRERTCTLFGDAAQAGTVTALADAVIPTGGGYFFSPSISALRDVLAVKPS